MEKLYAVVHFLEQNSYSEIPSNWLLSTNESTGITECKWPPSYIKNLNFQFKNRITPADNWPTYEVKLIRYCDTLKQARKAAEDSDFSASEGPQGKGHRLKFPSATATATTTTTSKYPLTSGGTSSDDENDKGDNGKKPAAEMPKMDKKLQKKSTKVPPTTRFSESDKGCPNNNDQPLEVQNLESIEENNDLSNLEDDKNNNSNAKKNVRNDKFSEENILNNGHDSSVPSEHDSNIINGDDDERFHTLNEKLDSCLRLLGTLMVDMKDMKQQIIVNNGEVMNETTSIVKNDLPLNSREEVSVFNGKLLESMDYYREFVRVVKQVGGAHGREHTERVLHTIFSKSFAAQNTWEGKKTKFKLNDLKLIKTCEEVILKKFPSWTSAEFSKAATNWFRLGSQRAGLQKGQRQKQKDHEDTRNKDTSE